MPEIDIELYNGTHACGDIDSNIAEVQNARTGVDGTAYQTLKARLDAENTNLIDQIYDFTNQRISAYMNGAYFWAFESGTAVKTAISGSNWRVVSDPIPVKEGEKYRIVGNQGASHKVRIWIITNDDMEVIATAQDYYESPNAGTLYTDDITIPEGGTKLLLTTTTYAPFPFITLYKATIGKKPLKGKYLSLMGDSISAFAGTIPSGHQAYYTGSNSGVSASYQMWWNILCAETGMIPLIIDGWSGSGITQLSGDHANKTPMSDTSRDQALHSGSTNPDVVVIAGGVNDYTYADSAANKPSSWDGTTTPVKSNSFTEAYACMIKEIQTAYPQAIVVCLSTWFTMRGTDNGYTLLNGEGNTQADYDKEIEKVANIMRVPFIRVSNCGFNRANFYPNYAVDSSTIPTHPNALGHRIMGEHIANILQQLVSSFERNKQA